MSRIRFLFLALGRLYQRLLMLLLLHLLLIELAHQCRCNRANFI